MKNRDLYWMTNREWWEYDGHVRKLREDAPQAAKDSFLRDEELLEKKRFQNFSRCEISLPDRDQPPSKIEKEAARQLLLDYRERAILAGRSTESFDSALREMFEPSK